jgi:WD40 repeat protein
LQGLEAGVFPLDPRSGKAPLRLPLLANFPFGEPVLESSAHAFTPDGTGLICRTDVLQRWDLATGKPVFPATERWGHTDGVTRLLFSADGRFLASASRGDESAYVWELGSGRALHAIQTGGEHLALTPDGRHVLTSPKNVSGEYVPLQMWDVKTGGVTRSFSKNWWFEWLNFAGQELRVTPDGKKVFMLTDSDGTKVTGTLYAWHLENGKRISRRTVPWGPGSVLTPDCASVVACDEQGVVRVLEVNTAKPRLAFRLDHPHGGDEQPTDCKLALSPDGRLMAARFRYPREDGEEADTGPCYLGDMASGRQIAAVDCEGPAAFTFSEDGRLFAVASGDVVRLWETASGRKAGSIQVPAQPGGNPAAGPAALAVALSPDGRTLATGHADGTILLWDATLREGARGGPLSAARVQALWADLADADAGRAYVAVWALADDAQLSVPALRDRLRPVAPAAAEKIKALIADLDNDRFDTREAAERTLREFGEGAVPALREALGRELPVECKRRLEGVVASLEPTSLPSREQLRQVRAVMVLERAGTAEARQFLERLAGGVESARLTRAAHDAVKRMAKK